MLQLQVLRTANNKATPGILCIVRQGIAYSKVCYTLEPSQTNGAHPDIPEGIYELVVAWSDHFDMFLPHIMNVPGRTFIEMHPGNSTVDTEGCTLVGEAFDKTNNTLIQSRDAFNYLMSVLPWDTEHKVMTDKVTIEYKDA